MTAIPYVLIALVIGAILYYARKGGADAVKAKSATETLEDVANANRPVGLSERELLQSKYRRD